MSVKLARTSVAAVLASTLLLAGCNSGDKTKDADKAPTSQSTQSQSTGTPSAGGTPSTDGGSGVAGGLTKDTFYSSILAAQKKAGSFKVKASVDAGGMNLTMNSEMAYAGDGVRAHVATAPGSSQQVEAVLAGGIAYLKVAGLPIPAGKWLKIDPKDPKIASTPFASLATLADPENALRVIGDPEQVTLVGAETVAGQQTDHYRVTVASKKYAENLKLPAEAAGMLPETLTFDMWVDGENRPVKMHQELTVQGQKTSTDQLYSDYGAPVKVAVPAASDTVTPSQLNGS
jgi:hypothetical protein